LFSCFHTDGTEQSNRLSIGNLLKGKRIRSGIEQYLLQNDKP
jgi:hypothetical protein